VRATVVIGYADVDPVRQLLPGHEVEIVSQDFAEQVTYELRLPDSQLVAFRARLLDVTRGQARFVTP
jgi:putative IMPACT (imprinted ancient) family translation regulator